MQIMGNSRARAVYEANIPEGFRRPQTDAQLDTFIRAKYEKKKYIAREYIPQKAPDLPDGWTALIEAEKAKKDIRNIVLPSHTKASSNSDDSAKRFVKLFKKYLLYYRTLDRKLFRFFSRERQSPKDVVNKSTTSSSPPKKASSSNAEKATLNSNFDLLSLNTSIPTKSAADKTSPKPTSISNIPTPKATATIANDLLCLGGTKLQHNTIILAKLKLLQSNSGKPLRIHDFFRPKNFHKFSRQIEVVKQHKTVVFSRIFQLTNFHNFSRQIEVVK